MSPLMNRAGLDALRQVIASRRSVRRYASMPITRELIDELLSCAVNAPSAHNRQPWRFIVLRDLASKTTLADAMGRRLRSHLLQDGIQPSHADLDVDRSSERIRCAPVAILVFCTTEDMDVYPDSERQGAEYTLAVQSTSMAVQNLLLAAHSAGLAGCWMCAPMFCPDVVRATLTFPTHWHPQALVTLGIPLTNGKPYTRRPLSDVVRYVEDM